MGFDWEEILKTQNGEDIQDAYDEHLWEAEQREQKKRNNNEVHILRALCRKEILGEVTVFVDDNASEADIQQAVIKAMYGDDVVWEDDGCKYEMLEEPW